jgi:VWFA-related protein
MHMGILYARGPAFARARLVLLALISLAIDSAAHAQGTPGAERTLDLLTVDFVVVGRDGHPVPDLTAADVTVRIDGRTRPLRSLQFVTAADPPPAGAAPAGSPMPPPFGSNDDDGAGRIFYLVLDDDSFRPGRETPLREAVARFLAGLALRDRVALVTMPYGGVKVPLTTDHSRVRVALSTIVGQGSAETGSDLACRSRRTLESLTGLLDTFARDDSPKTVMFVSAGLAGPRRDAPVMLAPGPCELTSDVFQQVGTAAGAARAQFYLVQPEDVAVRGSAQTENIAGVGFRGSDNPVEGLEHLAGVTGAHRLNLTGLPETAFGRIARETSGYYVASFAPARSDRTGRTHQLAVRVARPDAVVRARPEITFPKPDEGQTTTVRAMVLGGRAFTDLRLRASAYTSRSTEADKLKVVAFIEPADPAVKIATLAAVLFDEAGRPAAQWTGSGADITATPVVAGMLVPPGTYRLRVGAIDAIGRGGAVEADVDAGLTPAGALRLSSIVLGLSREGNFLPRLQFGAEPVVLGYVEIYDGTPGMRVTAALEVATTLNGPAILTVPLAIQPMDTHHVAQGAVPIGALPPGDYVIRALIGVEGQPMARVVRTLRKRVKG